jgi:hypothetical protein
MGRLFAAPFAALMGSAQWQSASIARTKEGSDGMQRLHAFPPSLWVYLLQSLCQPRQQLSKADRQI